MENAREQPRADCCAMATADRTPPHDKASSGSCAPTGSGHLTMQSSATESFGIAQPWLGMELLGVVARLDRLANAHTQSPLSWAQQRVLATLAEMGVARITELAAFDHCSQPSISITVRYLEDAGLVARTNDPSDKRGVLVKVTPNGVRALTRARVERGAIIDPGLRKLDRADRATLAAAVPILGRLIDNVPVPDCRSASLSKCIPQDRQPKPLHLHC